MVVCTNRFYRKHGQRRCDDLHGRGDCGTMCGRFLETRHILLAASLRKLRTTIDAVGAYGVDEFECDQNMWKTAIRSNAFPCLLLPLCILWKTAIRSYSVSVSPPSSLRFCNAPCCNCNLLACPIHFMYPAMPSIHPFIDTTPHPIPSHPSILVSIPPSLRP